MYTRFIYVYSSLYSKAALLNYELEVDITGCPLVTVAQSDTLEHFAQRYPLYIWRTSQKSGLKYHTDVSFAVVLHHSFLASLYLYIVMLT